MKRPINCKRLFLYFLFGLSSCADHPTTPTEPGQAESSSSKVVEVGDQPPRVVAEGMPSLVREKLQQGFAGVEAEPESAAAWLTYGKQLHAHQQLDEALECYRHVQALDSEQARAFHLGALIERGRGQLELALAGFERTVAISRKNGGRGFAPAQTYAAQVLDRLGRAVEAEELYKSTVAEFGKYQLVRLEYAGFLLAQNRAADALVQLQWLSENAPQDSRVVTAMADAERLLGNTDRATELAQATQSLEQTIPTLDVLMADMLEQGGGLMSPFAQLEQQLGERRFDEVVRGAKLLLAGGSTELPPRVLLARGLQGLGKHAEALIELEWALERSPNANEIKLLAARSANRVDRPADAERWALEVLKTEESGSGRSIVGEALVLQSKWTEADAQFGQLLVEHKKLGISDWMMWGTAQLALGKHADGANSFRAVTLVDPNYAPAQFNLGLAFQLLGDFEGAMASYESAGMLDPRLAGEVSGRIEECRGALNKQ